MSKMRLMIFILVFILSACVPNLPQDINKKSQDITAPDSFVDQNSCDANCELVQEKNLASQNWRTFFDDEHLIGLIDIALKNNQEINILNQEINIANNEVMARQGEYLPKFGVGASYEYEKVGKYTSQGKSDELTQTNEKLNNHQLALNTTWEIDIWKKLRHAAKSAYYEYLSSIEGKKYATTKLVAEISANYYEILALHKKLDIIEEYITTLEKVKEVSQLQQMAARGNSLAVKRFSAELLKNQSRKFAIVQEVKIAQNRLNNLLGRLPQDIDFSDKNFMETTLPEIAIGVPTDLLNNRADVKQAALKLKSAKFNIKSVKARFYPALSIDGNLGYQAFNASHLLESPSSVFYNIAGGISAPILNRKAIKADYFSANNHQIQAIYDYEKTFITAYMEVSNQLISIENLQKRFELKSQETDNLSDSVEIANILFRAARVDYLESLLTKRDYLEAKIDLVEVKQKQILSYINLYKALGGGWKE